MRRQHLVLFAVVLGMLAAPADASAKEISQVQVCGSHGQCTTYDTSDFKSLMFLAQDAGPTDPPAAAAPWYRVRFTVDEREHGGGYDRWTVGYVPSAGSLRVRDDGGGFTWVALTPRAAAALERAARAVPALPGARLTGLRAELPAASADEPSAAAGRAAATHESTGGSAPWGWIGAGALGAALLLAALGRTVRRRRHVQPAGM
jgi:hypothetical protein